jgi:POT family proton-dependent oligopeptide transporter
MRQLEMSFLVLYKHGNFIYCTLAVSEARETSRSIPTMSSGALLEIADVATAHVPAIGKGTKDEEIYEKRESFGSTKEDLVGPNGEQYPTEEEWTSLRRVYGKVDWMIYIIGIVEMCERFAYYGTTAVCK